MKLLVAYRAHADTSAPVHRDVIEADDYPAAYRQARDARAPGDALLYVMRVED